MEGQTDYSSYHVVIDPGTWFHSGAVGSDEERKLLALFAPFLQRRDMGSEMRVHVAVYRGTLIREWARSALEQLYRDVPGLKEGKIFLLALTWSAGLDTARIMEEIHCRETGAPRLWSVVGSLGGLPRTGVPTWQVFKICVKRPRIIAGGLFRGLTRYLPPGLRNLVPAEKRGMTWTPEATAEDFFGMSLATVMGLHVWGRFTALKEHAESFFYVASIFFPIVKWFARHAPLRAPIEGLFIEGDPFVPPGTHYPGEKINAVTIPGVRGHAGFFMNTGSVDDEIRMLWRRMLLHHSRANNRRSP